MQANSAVQSVNVNAIATATAITLHADFAPRPLAMAHRTAFRRRTDGAAAAMDSRAYRRISHVGIIPSFTTRDGDRRHLAVRDAATRAGCRDSRPRTQSGRRE